MVAEKLRSGPEGVVQHVGEIEQAEAESFACARFTAVHGLPLVSDY